MRKARTVGALGATLLAGLLATAGPVAAAPGDVDQQYLADSGTSIGLYCFTPTGHGLMQGVTPGVTSWQRVSLLLENLEEEEVLLPVEIRAGSPTGEVLGSASVTLPAGTPGVPNESWVDFDFEPPVAVPVGGSVYIFAGTASHAVLWWGAQSESSYAGGSAFSHCLEDPLPISFGGIPGEFDFAFITYSGDDDDESDPTGPIVDAVGALPADAFRTGGNQTAFLSRMADVSAMIASGDIDGALDHLENLRRHVDGCVDAAGAADRNDWITDCSAQLAVRALIDALIADLMP